MTHWFGRIATRRAMAAAAGLLLAIAGLFTLSVSPARAATAVESWWHVGSSTTGYDYEVLISCTSNTTETPSNGGGSVEVYNPCPYRVWLHAAGATHTA